MFFNYIIYWSFDGTLASEFSTPAEFFSLASCREMYDLSDPAQLEAAMKARPWAKPSDFKTRYDIVLYLEKMGVPAEVAEQQAEELAKDILRGDCTFSEVYSYTDSGPSVKDVATRIAMCSPKFETWNYSDKYNIGPASSNLQYGDRTTSSTGIPSGEDVTNEFGSDDWIAGFNNLVFFLILIYAFSPKENKYLFGWKSTLFSTADV